jgi:hypothetical protein
MVVHCYCLSRDPILSKGAIMSLSIHSMASWAHSGMFCPVVLPCLSVISVAIPGSWDSFEVIGILLGLFFQKYLGIFLGIFQMKE